MPLVFILHGWRLSRQPSHVLPKQAFLPFVCPFVFRGRSLACLCGLFAIIYISFYFSSYTFFPSCLFPRKTILQSSPACKKMKLLFWRLVSESRTLCSFVPIIFRVSAAPSMNHRPWGSAFENLWISEMTF